jgi:5-methylcytosine-specific restriction protein A
MEALQPGQMRRVALQPLWRTHKRLRTSRLPGQAAAVTAFPDAVRRIVEERSGGLCEGCWFHPAEQIHHRRPRGMGGSKAPDTNTASNGLALCFPCHAWTESKRESAEQFGWLVPQGKSPAEVPVLRHGCDWVLLDDHGNATPCKEQHG